MREAWAVPGVSNRKSQQVVSCGYQELKDRVSTREATRFFAHQTARAKNKRNRQTTCALYAFGVRATAHAAAGGSAR